MASCGGNLVLSFPDHLDSQWSPIPEKTPQWIAKTHTDYKVSSRIKGKQLSLDSYHADYRKIQEQYQEVKEIRWSHFQDIPVYQAIIGNKEYFFDASGEQICPLTIPAIGIEKAIRSIHGDSMTYQLQLITTYENYYLPWKRELALPVYKVEVNDPDQSLYYINPQTGEFKYLNTNRKVRKWLFSGLHYFHFKPLTDFPVVWTIVIWFLTGGCIVVTATGTWLSFTYLKRHLKRKS
ncbi:MAG: hypothetical protein LUG51_00005 [Tannerellaceae bacterium]|nr:hypothetical protein [Tannerellaceae bacterium]